MNEFAVPDFLFDFDTIYERIYNRLAAKKTTSGLIGFFKMAASSILDFPTFKGKKGQGSPPSWIGDARVWTTCEGHLAVFIIMQNLVGIDKVDG